MCNFYAHLILDSSWGSRCYGDYVTTTENTHWSGDFAFIFQWSSWFFFYPQSFKSQLASLAHRDPSVKVKPQNTGDLTFPNFQKLSVLFWKVSCGKQRWFKQKNEVGKDHLRQSTSYVQENKRVVMRMVIEILWESCYSSWDREGLRQSMRSNQGIGDPMPGTAALIYSCLLACLWQCMPSCERCKAATAVLHMQFLIMWAYKETSSW